MRRRRTMLTLRECRPPGSSGAGLGSPTPRIGGHTLPAQPVVVPVGVVGVVVVGATAAGLYVMELIAPVIF